MVEFAARALFAKEHRLQHQVAAFRALMSKYLFPLCSFNELLVRAFLGRQFFYHFLSTFLNMWTAALAPVAPKLCVSAISAFGTVRSPALPVNWSKTSTTCPTPVAPIGWPFDFSPPDGLTGI